MATMAASSSIVSRSSNNVYHGPSVSCESKRAMGLGSLRQTNTYSGLRILNPLDELVNRSRTPIEMKAMKTRRKGLQGKNIRPSSIIICGMNLIFVGTEVGPWSKTGGLGDVLGGLPPALAANGHRVMTIAPRYDQYKDAWDTSVTVEVKVGDRKEKVGFFHCFKRGVDRVFVDHPLFLEKVWGKSGTKLYGPAAGDDYQDNQLRFSLFCQAALEAPRVLNLKSNEYFSGPYGEDVIFVANDWHTALISCYLKAIYQPIGIFKNARVLEGKALLKEALQAEVGLPVDRNIPLIGFIGRLEEQKGSDILVEAIPQFIKEDVQIVALGTGKKEMEKQLQQLETAYPDNARGVAKFNVPLAHMIIAGADFILVPSRFEPCGLIQLQAMRYGTVPIVASTGGLVDTVKEGFTGFQIGPFNVECEAVDPADVDALAKTVKRALAVFGTLAFTEMIKNCMALDLSWKGPAKKWEEVLLKLGVPGSEPGIDGEEIAPQAKENVATP